MTQTEMIAFIKANPYVKITHRLFEDDEYIYSAKDGCVYEENNYLFEDWDESSWAHNGIRMRSGAMWDDGWEVKGSITTEECEYHMIIPAVGLCCKAYYLSKGYKGCGQRHWMNFPFCMEENCPLKHPEILNGATLDTKE